MRFKSPLIAISAVGVLALSACGGSGSSSGSSTETGPDTSQIGNTGNGQCPTCKGPVTIAGAKTGGTVTVLTLTGLTTTLDPSEVYYTDTSSIESGLITRSLTQYKYDPKTKDMILVPDLATDLGQHNDNYTKWTFTIRSGVKWGENGQPVTAKDVAFGMTRCMDAATFPTGACQYYSNVYYKGGSSYKGMYTAPGLEVQGHQGQRRQDHDLDGQALPGHAVLGHLPGQRPGPAGQGQRPEDLQEQARGRPVPT